MDERKEFSEKELQEIKKHIQELQAENERLYGELNDRIREKQKLKRENKRLNNELYKVLSSKSWKWSKPIRLLFAGLRKMKSMCVRMFTLLFKMLKSLKKNGIKKTITKIKQFFHTKTGRSKKRYAEYVEHIEKRMFELEEWIKNTPHSFIDIFPSAMGWNTPLFQRFQHISLNVGKLGGISLYGGNVFVDKELDVCEEISDSLCIVDLEIPLVVERLWEMLDKLNELKIVRIQSIDLVITIDDIESLIERGYHIVYEYIDEITPQITQNVPEFVLERHEYILADERITVVATSDKLYKNASAVRSKNIIMLNNGVDCAHWEIDRNSVERPEDIEKIVDSEKIIVGYHGALAQWIDYDLLKRIADDGRYILLLIGHEHDDKLQGSGLLDKKNVVFLGAKSYFELNRYAAFYDIGILPFEINDITLSVSPVKIFEYMAAGKPVVSYALPECKKYESCLCAETQDEFLEKLELAASLRGNAEYLIKLKEDAQENSWESITGRMLEYVKKNRNIKKVKPVDEVLPVLSRDLDSLSKDTFIREVLSVPRYYDEEMYKPLTDTPYARQDGDCKVIAYYLTQFHPDAHNEEWWGRGVTEWNNVSRAVPQFEGHYQPRLPGELGFYDLRILDNMKRQIELAKMYGVYGFSFYYYWFDGERLLEKPLEVFLQHPELDIPFSLCWANENWTKRFDGTNLDILIEQPKSLESYFNVITDIARFLNDSRYITVDGRKMLTVYRPNLMPQPEKVLAHWREYCRSNGLGELYIIAVKEVDIEREWLEEGFDAISEFHPGTLYRQCLKINADLKFMREDFGGEVFSYKDIVVNKKYFRYDYPKLYRAAMPMWDNTARRDNKGMIFHGSTPALYKRWLKDIIKAGKEREDLEDNFIFINAWNEWGEGAYLEPDKRYGYAYLEATKEAVEECRQT